MSSSTTGQTTTPSDFKSILDAALSEYKKKTGKELLDHPLAPEVQRCDSVDAILAIIRGQAKAFQRFRDGDQRLMKWIGPVVDVLFTFSATLSEGVALAPFPPAKVIWNCCPPCCPYLRLRYSWTPLTPTLDRRQKDVRASHDALVELFERIESFFKATTIVKEESMMSSAIFYAGTIEGSDGKTKGT
ncbi:hypothetical protein EDB89DRAFT_2073004 [Lactarius sanguifluus]|nr:hypothetical protein EDB89DRAFT_2073004 [Lactarius sanguifluus]